MESRFFGRDEVHSNEDALADLSFTPLAELNGPLFPRLEIWSQFCVRHLDGA